MKNIFIPACTILLLVLYSCGSTSKKSITTSQEIIVSKEGGSCSYLTRDNNNNIVVSWISEPDTATQVFVYAISTDEGKTFGEPVQIPGSNNVHPHGENMPKIIFKPSGEIIAAWGAANPNPKNKYSGLVYYSRSLDEGETWTSPAALTADTNSYDQRFFDMALLPDGEVGIIWLDNRKNWQKEGSAMYYAVTKGESGFQDERLISGPCCQCCRTDLFIDKNANIHVLYRGIINDSIRDMVHIVSADNGKSFSSPKRISEDNWVLSGCPHTGPAMAENKSGFHFTWFTAGDGAGIYYNNAKQTEQLFSKRSMITGSSSKHSQITTLPNGRILIIWDEAFSHNNAYSNRVGIQLLAPNGTPSTKDYLTSANSSASFPVLMAIDNNRALFSYTENIDDKNYVRLKQMNIP